MRVKLKESTIDTLFEEALFGNNVLNEELNKTDERRIHTLARKEIKNYLKSTRNKELDDAVGKIVKEKIKGDKDLENKFEDIVRDMLIEMYKTFWTKRNQIFKSLKA